MILGKGPTGARLKNADQLKALEEGVLRAQAKPERAT
jgi:hypothetical protein